MAENITQNVPAVVQRALQEQKVGLKDCNLMLPTQTFGEVLGMYDRVTVEVITINPDPEHGEVFPMDNKDDSDKLAFGKIPLQKISNAVGIVWDPKTTTILESTDTKSRGKATGAMRKPNGEYIVVSEEKTVDLGAIEEEQRLKIEKDAERGKIVEQNGKIVWEKTSTGKSYPKREPFKDDAEKAAWIDREVRKALIAYRKFKDERAMTGAKERVIRAFLAIKSTYTRAELAKPFAFPRVTTDTARMLASPETRAAAVEQLTGSVATIFGPRHPDAVDVTPSRQALPIGLAESSEQSAQASEEDDEPSFGAPEPAAESKPDPREPLRAKLDEYHKRQIPTNRKNGSLTNWGTAIVAIDSLLAKEPAASEDELNALIVQVEDYLHKLEAKRQKGAAA